MEHNKFNFILVLGKDACVRTLLCPPGLCLSVDPSDLVCTEYCTVVLYTTTATAPELLVL